MPPYDRPTTPRTINAIATTSFIIRSPFALPRDRLHRSAGGDRSHGGWWPPSSSLDSPRVATERLSHDASLSPSRVTSPGIAVTSPGIADRVSGVVSPV